MMFRIRNAAVVFVLFIGAVARSDDRPAWVNRPAVEIGPAWIDAVASEGFSDNRADEAYQRADGRALAKIAEIAGVSITARENVSSTQRIVGRESEKKSEHAIAVQTDTSTRLKATTCPDHWTDRERQVVYVRCRLNKELLRSQIAAEYAEPHQQIEDLLSEAREWTAAGKIAGAFRNYRLAEGVASRVKREGITLAQAYLPDQQTLMWGGVSWDPATYRQKSRELIDGLAVEIHATNNLQGHVGGPLLGGPITTRLLFCGKSVSDIQPEMAADPGTEVRTEPKGEIFEVSVPRLGRPSGASGRSSLRFLVPQEFDSARRQLGQIQYSVDSKTIRAYLAIEGATRSWSRSLLQAAESGVHGAAGIKLLRPSDFSAQEIGRIEPVLDAGNAASVLTELLREQGDYLLLMDVDAGAPENIGIDSAHALVSIAVTARISVIRIADKARIAEREVRSVSTGAQPDLARGNAVRKLMKPVENSVKSVVGLLE